MTSLASSIERSSQRLLIVSRLFLDRKRGNSLNSFYEACYLLIPLREAIFWFLRVHTAGAGWVGAVEAILCPPREHPGCLGVKRAKELKLFAAVRGMSARPRRQGVASLCPPVISHEYLLLAKSNKLLAGKCGMQVPHLDITEQSMRASVLAETRDDEEHNIEWWIDKSILFKREEGKPSPLLFNVLDILPSITGQEKEMRNIKTWKNIG